MSDDDLVVDPDSTDATDLGASLPTENDAVVDEEFVRALTDHLDLVAERSAPVDGVEFAEFEAIVSRLRDESAWAGPPVDLRSMIMASVAEEAALATTVAAPWLEDGPVARLATTPELPVGPAVAPVSEPAPARAAVDAEAERPRRRTSPWWTRMTRLRFAIPAAVMAVALFTVGVVAIDRSLQPRPVPRDSYVAAGTALAPDATAKVSVLEAGPGFPIVFAPTDLPAAAPGSYYAAWLRGSRGTVALGTFHGRKSGTSIQLWSGVDPRDYESFVVTLQTEGDPPTPSTLVVMTGTLRP